MTPYTKKGADGIWRRAVRKDEREAVLRDGHCAKM